MDFYISADYTCEDKWWRKGSSQLQQASETWKVMHSRNLFWNYILGTSTVLLVALWKLHRDFQFTHYWIGYVQLDHSEKQIKLAVGTPQADSRTKGSHLCSGNTTFLRMDLLSHLDVQVMCIKFKWKKETSHEGILEIFNQKSQEPLYVFRVVICHLSLMTEMSLYINCIAFTSHHSLVNQTHMRNSDASI